MKKNNRKLNLDLHGMDWLPTKFLPYASVEEGHYGRKAQVERGRVLLGRDAQGPS